jgi:hypothetical protein
MENIDIKDHMLAPTVETLILPEEPIRLNENSLTALDNPTTRAVPIKLKAKKTRINKNPPRITLVKEIFSKLCMKGKNKNKLKNKISDLFPLKSQKAIIKSKKNNSFLLLVMKNSA